jgi:hypothetical protein
MSLRKRGRVGRREIRRILADMEIAEPATAQPIPAGPLRAPPGGQPVGYARMARAIGEAVDRLMAAEAEIGPGWIAERPAAFPACKIEQGAARRIRRRLEGRRRGHQARCGYVRAQDLREPHASLPRLRRCRPHLLSQCGRSPAGPPAGRKTQAVDLADHGVACDADLGSDLAAGEACGNKTAELFNALRRPSHSCTSCLDVHGWPRERSAASWAADRAKAFARNGPSTAALHLVARNQCPRRTKPRSPSRIHATGVHARRCFGPADLNQVRVMFVERNPFAGVNRSTIRFACQGLKCHYNQVLK